MSTRDGTIDARFTGRLGGFALDAAFRAPAHGVTALFGPSGCGKTTLLRCVAGLERMAGRLAVAGDIWQDDARGRFLRTHERPIGYVFQEASLFPHLSVRRNLEFGQARTAPADRRVRFAEVAELSPRLLLMDEPLASLDQISRDEILPFLERLHDELAMPVLYVSHSAEEVARLADHLVLLDAGRVRASGPIAELRARLDLARGTGSDADAIVDCRVAGHDDAFHLSYLDFPGGRVSVPRHDLPVGRAVRLRVLARDVSVTLAPQTGTSILNIFPAVVEELAEESAAQLLVRLGVGGTPLLARITRKSAALLDLAPGRAVYAQVKAVALLA